MLVCEKGRDYLLLWFLLFNRLVLCVGCICVEKKGDVGLGVEVWMNGL